MLRAAHLSCNIGVVVIAGLGFLLRYGSTQLRNDLMRWAGADGGINRGWLTSPALVCFRPTPSWKHRPYHFFLASSSAIAYRILMRSIVGRLRLFVVTLIKQLV